MISILVLFLLMGVAYPRHISYYDNATDSKPMVTMAEEGRICAELCMAGLGGEPCGRSCSDVIPQGLPTLPQRQSDSYHDHGSKSVARTSACPILCSNRLGYPLCACNATDSYRPFFRVDYHGICAYFCTSYHYQIYGCHQCSYYNATKTPGVHTMGMDTEGDSIDWNLWCQDMCKEGEGGAACYCDLLPMALEIAP